MSFFYQGPITFDYVLHGHKLEHVQTVKYLGVTISHDMRWDTHLDNIVLKGNQALGFLRRNLQIRSEDLKTTAHNTNSETPSGKAGILQPCV